MIAVISDYGEPHVWLRLEREVESVYEERKTVELSDWFTSIEVAKREARRWARSKGFKSRWSWKFAELYKKQLRGGLYRSG